MLETNGESFGGPTPAGSVLPSSERRSEMPWRAMCTSMLSANVIVTTESPGMDSERMVARPDVPFTAFSTGLRDQFLDLLGRKPGRFGLDVDFRRHEVGKNIERRVPRRPNSRESSASKLSALTAPK